MIRRYELREYDVLGNAKDGFEVNNSWVICDDIMIDDDASEKEILTYLKTMHAGVNIYGCSVGFLNTDDMRRVRLDMFGDAIEIYAVKGCEPLGCLMPYCKLDSMPEDDNNMMTEPEDLMEDLPEEWQQ